MSQSTPSKLKLLEKFLSANPEIDFFSVNLFDPAILASLSWKGTGRYKARITKEIQAFQRLTKILATRNDQLVFQLINAGLLSAIQVAAMSKKKFMNEMAAVFGGDLDQMEHFYQRALQIRAQVLVNYMQARQNNEPHALQSVITPKKA